MRYPLNLRNSPPAKVWQLTNVPQNAGAIMNVVRPMQKQWRSPPADQ